ncbi:Late embryogenesis abundant protein LEA_2 subgroup [Arabidopsis suecica]|uniref:Late embryogenesis abundant protein LEA_2 subgroup n=1 Tax=Arabidopsis suecica TaxID=45249 RepID=A0A8T2B4V2_ARASU|nr:Late embryogenesis abundant protein LEA_2 subgroup [Arabidopsis suecica]
MSKRRICCIVSAIIFVLFAIFIVALILAQVFKPKHPILQTVSSTVDGISTNISLPYEVQLNFTLTLQMLLKNPNVADFEYKTVENLVYYRDTLVGNLTLPSSTLPAKGSVLLACPLFLQLDKFVANLGDIVQDVLHGKIVMETKARMPGKITLLGIFKIHLDSISHCNLVLGFPSMEVVDQVCDLSTKL